LQKTASVLSFVAILTLALAAPNGVRGLEILPLPPVPGPVAVRLEPLESRLVLSAPRAAPELARALRALGSALCGKVDEAPGEVRLTCRTRRLAASIVPLGRSAALEIRELAGMPVPGPEGFPLIPFDTVALGLSGCPGATPGARGECLLAAGDLDGARRAFAEAAGDEARGLAALRLGDLALLSGNPQGAESFWLQATLEPWKRIAAAHACEITDCSARDSSDDLFRPGDLPAPLAADLLVRGARAAAYRGRLLDAATRLAGAPEACRGVPDLCHLVLLAALRGPQPGSEGAALIYLALPDRERCPYAVDLAHAAADSLAASGAPEFAANLLAAMTPQVPEGRLGEHLLRTAEIYVAAGDPVRAGVVLEFARLRMGKKLPGPRWAAVSRALRPRRAAPVVSPPTPPAQAAPELGSAAAALARARALTGGATP
jgi:hypothetical protein